MINIYLTFETKNKIRFFKQLNLDIFNKYNINLRFIFKDSSVVFSFIILVTLICLKKN